MRISDWSSDVCSSDLIDRAAYTPDLAVAELLVDPAAAAPDQDRVLSSIDEQIFVMAVMPVPFAGDANANAVRKRSADRAFQRQLIVLAIGHIAIARQVRRRSEEHTSELQSLMRISYAVFCLKKNTK